MLLVTAILNLKFKVLNFKVYHAAPSHHFNVYKMQLPVWC